jgi:hypothetical protein
MTVADLIEQLKKMPPHAPVWIQMVLGFFDESEEGTSSVVASTVTWQGNHVEIE